MILRILIIIMSLSIMLSCNKSKHNKYDKNVLFSVDTLLTKTVVDISFKDLQIAIPRDWEKASERILNSIKNKNLSQTNIIKEIIPILAFDDSINKNFSLLSSYNNLESLDDFVTVFQDEITNNLKSDKMNITYFSNNDLNVCQIIIYNVNYINIKLIFQQSNRIYIFEYLVTTKYYKKNIKTIESSIGQLRKRRL